MRALTPENFDRIVRFILERGDRLTWCNMYNLNPHLQLPGFDAFLNPDVGQRNINCDPERSGFDELVIRFRVDGWEYLRVKRRGGAVFCEPGAKKYVDLLLAAVDAPPGAGPVPAK